MNGKRRYCYFRATRVIGVINNVLKIYEIPVIKMLTKKLQYFPSVWNKVNT